MQNQGLTYQRRVRSRRQRISFEFLERRELLHAGELHEVRDSAQNGIVLDGITADMHLGAEFRAIGDLNGDGVDDVLAGGSGGTNDIFIFFGSPEGASPNWDLTSLDGTDGFAIQPVDDDDFIDFTAAKAGDINGDSYDDLILGFPNADPNGLRNSGDVYVIYGQAQFDASYAIDSLTDLQHSRISGSQRGARTGSSVSAAGDFNGDNFIDLLVGSPNFDVGDSTNNGIAHIIFGTENGVPSLTSLSSLTPMQGVRFDGDSEDANFGNSVSSAGDLNNDGRADVIIGALNEGEQASGQAGDLSGGAGAAYVIFGTDQPPASVGVSTLDGQNGFVVPGNSAGEQLGQTVSGGGDLNNDGIDDVAVASPRAMVDGRAVGVTYVVYGKSTGFPAVVDISQPNSESLRLTGDYRSDPLLESVFVNTTGQIGYGDYVVNFTSVISDQDSVFLHTSGIPHYDEGIGPWRNQNLPTDQDKDIQLPRNPTEQLGEKSRTRGGDIGVWIDGLAIFNWSDARSYNDEGNWNRIAVVFEAAGFDDCNAHPPQGGTYHTHGPPTCLMEELGDDGSAHSPLLGWSFDGFPIYGPYGFTNADGTGEVKRMTSGWATRDITERTVLPDGTQALGPTLDEIELGSYREDFEYIGSSDLDEYNGRFAVTPEYPQGIYHYHVTLDANGDPAFPYTVGVEYFGVLEENNIGQNSQVDTIGDASMSIAFAADTNGDAVDDLLVGVPQHAPAGNTTGSAFLVYGSETLGQDIELGALDPQTGHVIRGEQPGGRAGHRVDVADVNDDGLVDLLISGPNVSIAQGNAGSAYIVYGPQLETLKVTSVELNASLTDPADLSSGPQDTSWIQQRSDLRSIELEFNVEVEATHADFILTSLGEQSVDEPDTTIFLDANHVSAAGSRVTISFANQELPDGIYQLDVLPSLTDRAGNPLDGNGDGSSGDMFRLTGNSQNGFYKLTGDWNGDGGVSIFDFVVLQYWFGSTTAPDYVDINGDQGVSIFDFTEFVGKFGESVTLDVAARSTSAPPLTDERRADEVFKRAEQLDRAEVVWEELQIVDDTHAHRHLWTDLCRTICNQV